MPTIFTEGKLVDEGEIPNIQVVPARGMAYIANIAVLLPVLNSQCEQIAVEKDVVRQHVRARGIKGNDPHIVLTRNRETRVTIPLPPGVAGKIKDEIEVTIRKTFGIDPDV